MVTSRREPITSLLRCSGRSDKSAILEALKNIQELSSVKGLYDVEVEDLVEVITSNKNGSDITIKLFRCLVPEKLVSNKSLTSLLSWYFTYIGSGKISKAVEKEFIRWIAGIVHFELGDISIIDSYFHSFLFLLRLHHMESCASKLLCLLLKPEDAKRWTVKKILEVQKKSGPKAHTNSILSILKSFRPDVVLENVPMIRMNYDDPIYLESFSSAHERRIHSSEYVPTTAIEIAWNQNRRFDKKSAHLPRLIPTPEAIDFEPSTYKTKKFCVMETKNMSSLGANCLRIEIPSQTLSLLTNVAGFHVLAFSDSVTKARFSDKIRHTLFRVFLLELEPYSVKEKTIFLDSIIGLQEYMQEGMPAVTEFLLHYLLIWDGEEFRDQIFSLLQWLVLKSATDWQEFLFRPIRQLFRSSGLYCKYLIIESMSSLLRNLIASIGRKENTFFDDSPVWNVGYTAKAIEDLANFVGGLVGEGIVWNTDSGRRDIITAAVNFYEICSLLDYSPEFPVVVLMPPTLVYQCLFSGSKICISRMCTLLLRFWKNTYENLLQLRNGDEFSVEIECNQIYILDYYRCLWSTTDYQQMKDSFLFKHKAFDELYWKFQNSFGVNIKRIFNVESSAAFIGNGDFVPQERNDDLSDYPSIVNLKLFCEDHVIQDCRQQRF